jgi:squalene synthase HpnC
VNDLTELSAADVYCRHLSRRHYENFSVISRFLPGAIATDLTRIYAYCRCTDDYGDESGNHALDRLSLWRDEVSALFAGRAPIHPVLIALRETVEQRRLSPQPFLDLIAANVQDQTVKQYTSWDELRAYCMLSAAPVGRMVLGVYGVSDRRAGPLSDDVCIGLQLANHAQDVRRDRALGRCYLLQSDLHAGSVADAVRSLSVRARELLRSGVELETLVPRRLRAQLALYRLGGNAILDRIEVVGYRTDLVRPVVTRTTKATLLVRALVGTLRAERRAHARPQTV